MVWPSGADVARTLLVYSGEFIVMSGGIRIVVIDDHPMFRQGLVWTLRHAKCMTVVAEGGTAGEALTHATTLQPDVLLLDLCLRGGEAEGLGIAQLVRQSFPGIRIVVVTNSENEKHVAAALKVGVAGYVLKTVSGQEMVQIVRDVHDGAHHVHPALAARLLTQAGAQQLAAASQPLAESKPVLTAREGEILELVGHGMTNKEVARHLDLSEKTIKHYMTAIMTKLGVRNRTEAVLHSRRRQKADKSAHEVTAEGLFDLS